MSLCFSMYWDFIYIYWWLIFNHIDILLLFIYFFRPAGMAYGNSQARGRIGATAATVQQQQCWIWAASVTYATAHSNSGAPSLSEARGRMHIFMDTSLLFSLNHNRKHCILFIHSAVGRYLGWSSLSGCECSYVNFCVDMCFISLRYLCRSRISGSYGKFMCNLFKEISSYFSSDCPIYISTSSV